MYYTIRTNLEVNIDLVCKILENLNYLLSLNYTKLRKQLLEIASLSSIVLNYVFGINIRIQESFILGTMKK